MPFESLLGQLRRGRGPEASSLDEYFDKVGQEAWNRLVDLARQSPSAVAPDVVTWAAERRAQAPNSFFALLLNLAARDEPRRAELVALYRKLLPSQPSPALHVAGYYLHEYCRILDREWIGIARDHFESDPKGAWGIAASAAMYRSELLHPEDVDFFEARRAALPRDYFVMMFSLGRHFPDRAPDFLARALRCVSDHPAAAVEAASFAVRSVRALLTPEVVAAVLQHFPAFPEKAWEFFDGASQARPEAFDETLLDRLEALGEAAPGTLFSVLRHLMDARPGEAGPLLDRYVRNVGRHPEKGIESAHHAFQREDIRLVRPDLVRALCAGFSANPYPAYDFLRRLAGERPELLGPPEVETALKNIPHATNYAFGFFRELLKLRPEFTRECTLSLFECLAQEPAYRAFMRAEEMESIVAIAEAARIRTGLENALREPPEVGSRRARALMAIMFRQKLRARRHVLLEALRYAATVVLWRKVPKPGGPPKEEESEKYSPIWDFLMFIIDHSSEASISTAAGERFLEGAFQLNYLCRTGAEHDAFLQNLNLGQPPPVPFPPEAKFVEEDPELADLYRLVIELGRRFATEPRISPLREFARRQEAARTELGAMEAQLAKGTRVRRKRLEERAQALRERLGLWEDPQYARAWADPAAAQQLPERSRAQLRREKKDLSKQLRDALRAEAIRIAVAAVDRSRLELYHQRLREVLGRDLDIETVEPRILPSFLWFQCLGSCPKSARYLRRLIEDRIAGRPHEWLRTEPAVLEWADRVQKSQPGIHLERWRAPYTKEYQYRPLDVLAEKRRRIKADLAQTKALLEKAGVKGIAGSAYEELRAKLEELRAGAPTQEKETAEKADTPARPPVDPAILEEVSMNLERVRLAQETPDSDYEGKIVLTVETDPFEVLFMGEYGFASCLALRGSNAWSAVSNAIDLDKVIVWAKEPAGNVVGRRLLAMVPEGILTFRTYTNRNGLALDGVFKEFIEGYAAHCGSRIVHQGHPGPLLSDRWYDDGAV
jgi:hypothetical protein